MNKYLLINPVAGRMYGEKFHLVKENLMKKRYIIAECEPQLEYVKSSTKSIQKD